MPGRIATLLMTLILLFSSVFCFISSWQIAVLYSISLVLFTTLLLKPDIGIYLLLFALPVTTFTSYAALRGKWNFIVVGTTLIDLIPLYAPLVLCTGLGFVLQTVRQSVAESTLSLHRRPVSNPLLIPVVMLVLYAGTTVFWSPIRWHTFFQFNVLAMNAAIFLIFVAYIKSPALLKKVLWLWLLSISCQALFSLGSFFFDTTFFSKSFIINDFSTTLITGFNFFGGMLQASGDPQVASGLQDHHETALLMNMAVPVALGLLLTDPSPRQKGILLVILFLLISVTLRTESRAGFGTLYIVCCIVFLALSRLRKKFILLVSCFSLLILPLYMAQQLGIAVVLQKKITPRLVLLGNQAVKSGDPIDPKIPTKKHSRKLLYSKSFKLYNQHYLIQGFGAGNLKKLLDAPHAHSIFFSLLFDFGLTGLLFMGSVALFFGVRLKGIVQQQSSYIQIMAVSLSCGVLSICIHGLVDFEYNTTTIWLYFALATAALNLTHQEQCRFGKSENRSWIIAERKQIEGACDNTGYLTGIEECKKSQKTVKYNTEILCDSYKP